MTDAEFEAAMRDRAKHEDSDGYFGFLEGARWARDFTRKEMEVRQIDLRSCMCPKYREQLADAKAKYEEMKAQRDGLLQRDIRVFKERDAALIELKAARGAIEFYANCKEIKIVCAKDDKEMVVESLLYGVSLNYVEYEYAARARTALARMDKFLETQNV